MRSLWWLRPWRTVHKLRESISYQLDMIDRQQHVNESLRIALRAAHVRIEQLTSREDCDPPDWVIVGKHDGEGLMVLGSNRPTHAEMSRKVAGYLRHPGRSDTNIPVMENKVAFTSPELTVIRCKSYPQGVQSLIEVWNRDSRPD